MCRLIPPSRPRSLGGEGLLRVQDVFLSSNPLYKTAESPAENLFQNACQDVPKKK